jgi:cytochrome c oxidase subunit 3
MIFFSVFWAFFHSALAPNIELGATWPPIGIDSINPWSLPLLGTCLLLASGFTVTLAHHALVLGNKVSTLINLAITILLGIVFVILQATEYFYCTYTIADSTYGNCFFISTGLHGLHVIAGVIF